MQGEEPIVSGMAGRYATALFELALEAGSLDAVSADLDRFEALLNDCDDLRRLVESPVFGSDEQLKAITAVLDKVEIGGLAGNFLKTITANRRLFAVQGILRGYRARVARHKGEVRAQVTVAEPLSDAHRTALAETLNHVTGKDVAIDVTVDPALIGGLIVKLGSRMVDASLRTKLNAIRHAMKEVG
ncbi:F0F1 ATP synthase subunit delta [Blastochloris sulfoviridis]|uniref:ATP synthase subunit delta n=1 Tax=Blastochloris sulfoviridis TaxID=50712 RepID=A0A5M6HMD6_9HYPH|nr:F0F1 ATP synthase subunit delta [Blastochloris sulfoviridis]KAA5596769.1 F0F1 ATP synthase subunit delta [Blastochloris sulfoviridis]